MSIGVDTLPRISFILATRNRCGQARAVIDMVLKEKESYPALELIVVDGASTDGTVDLLRSYGPRIDKWVSKPDFTVYEAYNTGLKLSTGDYVRVLSDDDQYFHESLSEIARYCADHPGVIIAGGAKLIHNGSHVRDERLDSVSAIPLDLDAFFRWPMWRGFYHESIFFPAELLARHGAWNESFRIAGDTDLIARLLGRGEKMIVVPLIVMCRKATNDSASIRFRYRGVLESMFVIVRHGYVWRFVEHVWCYGLLFVYRLLGLKLYTHGVVR